MKTNILSGLMIVALCGVCFGGITVTAVEPFEKADQPRWQIDGAKSAAVYIPEGKSLENPVLVFNSAAVADSSITMVIDSDAKKLQVNGQELFALDMRSAKSHTLFLSLKGADSTLILDGIESPRHKGLWQAVVAGKVAKVPLAFVGATYVTIHFQTGTQPPPVIAQPVVVVPGPVVVLQPPPILIPAPAPVVYPPFVMEGNGTLCADGSMVLTRSQRLTSIDSFRPPVDFKIVAKTDSTNIRIGYAADEIIFNWEMDRTQLRIGGGPASGKHVKGAGGIPINQWVVIDIDVTPDTLVICVDGRERDRVHADFSRVNQQLSIFPANGSTITVKSVQAVVGAGAVPVAATFTTPAPRGVSFEEHQRLEAAERAREQQETAERAQLQQQAADERALRTAGRIEPSRIASARAHMLQNALDHLQQMAQSARERGASPAQLAMMQRQIDDLNRQLQSALNQ